MSGQQDIQERLIKPASCVIYARLSTFTKWCEIPYVTELRAVENDMQSANWHSDSNEMLNVFSVRPGSWKSQFF